MGSEPGPFQRMDRVGLDVVLDIERHYAAESGLDRDAPPQFLIDMVERGELGVKTGKGFYDY
jgi:3-hydroxybutyryl-CoA dehydrogenase